MVYVKPYTTGKSGKEMGLGRGKQNGMEKVDQRNIGKIKLNDDGKKRNVTSKGDNKQNYLL